MADFAEVMRQWVRARKATASSTEENVLSVYPLEEYDDALIADIEKNIMRWAAENPEPVYPTWAEWLGRKVSGVDADSIYEAWHVLCTTPIPIDLAEKLGIEPKED